MSRDKKKTPPLESGAAATKSTRDLILDAAEQIMANDGYAAVTSRRIGEAAGVKAPLIHYHFDSMDDLFLALYERHAAAFTTQVIESLSSDQPLRAHWEFSVGASASRLNNEFLALANHRKIVRSEIARSAARVRSTQVIFLTRIFEKLGVSPDICMPGVFSLIIAGLARSIAIEASIGITDYHKEAMELVDRLLQRFEPAPATRRETTRGKANADRATAPRRKSVGRGKVAKT